MRDRHRVITTYLAGKDCDMFFGCWWRPNTELYRTLFAFLRGSLDIISIMFTGCFNNSLCSAKFISNLSLISLLLSLIFFIFSTFLLLCLCTCLHVRRPGDRWCGNSMSPPPRAAARPGRCPTNSTRLASMAGGSAVSTCLCCCSLSSWWSTLPSPSGSSGWCGSTRYAQLTFGHHVFSWDCFSFLLSNGMFKCLVFSFCWSAHHLICWLLPAYYCNVRQQ